MLRATKQWDVRCPPALTAMFPHSQRHGYYYKVDRTQARAICAALSKAYGIGVPQVASSGPGAGNYGCCYWLANGTSRIHVHGRGHIKTVFHEWYHALDHATKGKYNSSDRLNLAWQFAERLFEVFRKKPTTKGATMKTNRKTNKTAKTAKAARKTERRSISDNTVVKFVKARSKGGSRTKLLALVPKGGVTVSKLAALAKKAQVKVANIKGAVGFLQTYGYVRAA